MRILIATSSNYIAFHGQAIFTKNLSEGLAKKGHEVAVIAGSEKGHAYTLDIAGVHVEAIKSISLKEINPNAVFAYFPERAVNEIFKSFTPDIVHIQDHYPICNSVIAASKRAGVKIIGTNHFMPENLAAYIPIISSIKPVYQWLLWHWMRTSYDHLDMVVGPSNAAVDLLRKNSIRSPLQTISCGANDEKYRPLPDTDRYQWRMRYGMAPDKKIFFFVGRIDKEKRLDVILEAAKLSARTDFQIVFAGNGAYRSALLKSALSLDLLDKVHFTGFISDDDLPRVLNSIDVFVMPSEAELLSIATIQAMACARPIIAADAVALPELVKEGKNGMLFCPGDVLDATRCIDSMAEAHEDWHRMGAESLRIAQRHSIASVVEQYEYLYQQMIGRGGEVKN